MRHVSTLCYRLKDLIVVLRRYRLEPRLRSEDLAATYSLHLRMKYHWRRVFTASSEWDPGVSLSFKPPDRLTARRIETITMKVMILHDGDAGYQTNQTG